jgi:hypothetical protein
LRSSHQCSAHCQKGRNADIGCGSEPRMLHQSEPTFKLALIRVCLCSAEGSTEPSLPNAVLQHFAYAENSSYCDRHKAAVRNADSGWQEPVSSGSEPIDRQSLMNAMFRQKHRFLKVPRGQQSHYGSSVNVLIVYLGEAAA